MIIHEEPFGDKLKLQLVNGDDIMKSYRNRSKCASCMSLFDRWERTKFYSYIPKLSMLRVMKNNILMLRALIWEGVSEDKPVKVLGTIYHKSYPRDWCSSFDQSESVLGIKSAITGVWSNFADVRDTARQVQIEVNLPKNYKAGYPCIDVFKYLNEDKTIISNHPYIGRYRLTDHINGQLRPM